MPPVKSWSSINREVSKLISVVSVLLGKGDNKPTKGTHAVSWDVSSKRGLPIGKEESSVPTILTSSVLRALQGLGLLWAPILTAMHTLGR